MLRKKCLIHRLLSRVDERGSVVKENGYQYKQYPGKKIIKSMRRNGEKNTRPTDFKSILEVLVETSLLVKGKASHKLKVLGKLMNCGTEFVDYVMRNERDKRKER